MVLSTLSGNWLIIVLQDYLPKLASAWFKSEPYHREFRGENQDSYTTKYAPTAIACIALELEAYRNLLYHESGEEMTGKGISSDIVALIKKYRPDFPVDHFRTCLEEIMVVRDAAVHGHLYEIDMEYKEGELKKYKSRKLNLDAFAKQGDRKHRIHVGEDYKTRLLKLNAQPLQISYEDVLKALIVFDLTETLIKIYTRRDLMFTPYYVGNSPNEIRGCSVSRLIAYYYRGLKNQFFIQQVDDTVCDLTKRYSPFISGGVETSIINHCPECKAFGFKSIEMPDDCLSCSREKDDILAFR